MLARAFPTGNELILLLLLAEFQCLDAKTADENFRDREQYLRSETLGKLVNSARINALPEGRCSEPMRDLAETLRVRNALAHQPCWLRPVNDPDAGKIAGSVRQRTVAFVLCIADDKFIWEVDEDQESVWRSLFDPTAECLRAIRIEAAAKLANQPGKNHSQHVPVFVVLPAGRPIPNPETRIIQIYVGDEPNDPPLVPGTPLKKRWGGRMTISQPHVMQRIGTDSDGRASDPMDF